MKKNSWVLAVDIEASGATRTINGKPLYDASGSLISVGAVVTKIDEETKEVVLVDSLFIPLFAPIDATKYGGNLLVHKEGDSYCTPCTYEGVYIDGVSVETSVVENSTVFEQRCWDEIWCKHPDILKKQAISKTASTSREEREAIAIKQLIDFRIKAEQASEKDGAAKVDIVSDCPSFDIGWLDQTLLQYLPEMRPFTYRAFENHKYNGGILCTRSMQKGLLSVIDRQWIFSERNEDKKWMDWLHEEANAVKKRREENGLTEIHEEEKIPYWSLTKRIRYLYHIDAPDVDHDHNPVNDALTIAYEYWHIWGIGMGYYELDSSRVWSKQNEKKKRKTMM